MPSHLLDTSIYSQRLRPEPSAGVVRRWKKLGDANLAISSMCEAELRFGLAKRNSERLWREYRSCLENRILILPVDKQVADQFGDLKALLELRGTPRADFDLLIAATALCHRLTLVTANLRHFEDIPGLNVESWDPIK